MSRKGIPTGDPFGRGQLSQPNALGPVHYLCAGTVLAADPPPDVPPAQNSLAGVALAL